ncbi:MAG: metallophosphoesterase [Acidobacteriota bacterium]
MACSTFRIAHLSDLHLTPRDDDPRSEPRLFGKLKGMNAAFRRLARAQEVQSADALLITGDVTDRGDLATWRHFWETLDKALLRERTIVIPGNHDVCCLGLRPPAPSRMQSSWQRMERGLRLANQPTRFPWAATLGGGRAVMFALDSCNAGNTSFLTNAIGAIGHFQLEAFARLLRKHRDTPIKIVALHHSPNIPSAETERKRGMNPMSRFERLTLQVPEADRRALRMLCIAGGVRLVVHGHLHRAEDRRVSGVRIVGSPASTEPGEDGRLRYLCYELRADQRVRVRLAVA